MKNTKGITLIALVITIVIMIILAGVTIAMLTGENGIVNKANKANSKNNEQAAKEILNLKITNVQMDKYVTEQRMPTLKELADNFCADKDFEYVQETSKVASLSPIENQNPTSIYTKLVEYPYEFKIDSELKLAAVDGIPVATTKDYDKEIEDLKTTIAKMQSDIDTLNTEISELKQSQTLTTSTFSIISQKIKGNKIYLSQMGEIASIEIDGDSGSQNIQPKTLEKLATGLPKAVNAIQEMTITIDNPNIYARSWVDCNGVLYIYLSDKYTGNIFIGGTYLTK